MYSESQEYTGTSSFSASLSASGWGFSASGSAAMSSTHSESSSSNAATTRSSEGTTESQNTFSKAKLCSATLRWDDFTINSSNSSINPFRNKFLIALENLKNDVYSSYTVGYSNDTYVSTGLAQKIINFFGSYGTHVLSVAAMGSICRKTSFFDSSYSYQSYEISSDSANSDNSDFSGSFGGGSDFGFSASASVSYSQSSGSSYSSSREASGESSTSAKYSIDTIYCVGEVSITTECGEMLGRQDQPSIVEYQLKPIFEIDNLFDIDDIYGEYTKTTMKNVIENVLSHANKKCGNGVGIPSVNSTAWINSNYQTDFNGDDYGYFWDDTVCFGMFLF